MKRGFNGRTIKHASELRLGDFVWQSGEPEDKYKVVEEVDDDDNAACVRVKNPHMYHAARFGRGYIDTGHWRYDRLEICPFKDEENE